MGGEFVNSLPPNRGGVPSIGPMQNAMAQAGGGGKGGGMAGSPFDQAMAELFSLARPSIMAASALPVPAPQVPVDERVMRFRGGEGGNR